MVLFYNRTRDIQVLRTKDGTLGVDNIGVLKRDTELPNSPWRWYIGNLDLNMTDEMHRTEKLCVIEMLDKLNDAPPRRKGTEQARWREITGMSGATL